MAEPKRFHFDSEQRAIEAAGIRRRAWLWIGVSLALHGVLILFVLAGAARGGHTEHAGVIEVAVVGPLSTGEPDSRSRDGETAAEPPRQPEAPPSTVTPPEPPRPPSAARAPDTQPPKPAPEQRPDIARPPSATPPDAPVSPRPPEQARPADAAPKPPEPAKEATRPASVEPDALAPPRPPELARLAEAAPKTTEPPKEMKKIARPQPAEPETRPPRPPQQAEAPAEPTPPPQTEATPQRPTSPPQAVSPAAPPRPKAAREPANPKLAAARQGRREAPPGQTASLGSPNGGERLGRSDNDDNGGVININVNPRFRQPPAPPHYPRISIERDEEGVVLVRALVDPSGAPQRVVVFKSSGFPMLDESALKAVQGWRFEPMMREGRAVVSWVQVPVRFKLR